MYTGVIDNSSVLESLLDLLGALPGMPEQTAKWSQNAQKEFQGEVFNPASTVSCLPEP